MSFSNQGFPSYSFVMFLAFAAFGSYMWNTDPLQTARPLTQSVPAMSSSGLNAIPARLWQDPFQIIYARDKKGNSIEGIEELKDSCLVKNLNKNIGSAELLVLGVMVSTEAIADAEERRRRRRYALINALSKAGYVPEDAGHIHVSVEKQQDKTQKRLILPYEWYYSENLKLTSETKNQSENDACKHDANNRKKILVLWMDASHYHNQPFEHLSGLVKTLLPEETRESNLKKLRLTILGPASSSGLRTLIRSAYSLSAKQDPTGSKIKASQEVKELCQLVAGVHFLSPMATIADSLLYPGSDKKTLNRVKKYFSLENYNAGENKSCLTLDRTVHPDNKLMQSLVGELGKRNIKKAENHVILLSELDTDFSRALRKSFEQEFCGNKDTCEGNEVCLNKITECNANYIHTFNYLRGIDGVAPGGNLDLGLATLKPSNKKTENKTPVSYATIRRPIGNGQFDYLRRVADEIVRLDKKLREDDGQGILAVGILGNDVYDKLLILRALRSRLMGVTYFTTDLDSQFLHPAEFPWTRNLVVASSFDLKMKPEYQKSAPPFRDIYQTSVFYSAGLALKFDHGISKIDEIKDDIKQRTAMEPLLFEIGRNSAVRLENRATQKYSEIIKTVSREQRRFLPLLITFTILGLYFLFKGRNKPNWFQLRWMGVGMLVLVTISVIGISLSIFEEPFLFYTGVSVWPTEMINSLTLVLCLYFICESSRTLHINYSAIGKKYKLFSWAESQEKKYQLDNISLLSCVEKSDDDLGWSFILTTSLLFFGVLIGLQYLVIESDKSYMMLTVWAAILVFLLALKKQVKPDISIKTWITQINENTYTSIQQYWKSYGQYGALHNRFLRAFAAVLLFQAFVSLILTLFGLEPAPLRGDFTRFVNFVITASSRLGMLFLLFYMVDASRLCMCWIRGMTEKEFEWRGTAIENLMAEMNIPWSYAEQWLKLKLVAERTKEISKLIYYPFIIIILTLFSRINYFDDWGFPQSLAIITSVLIGFALYYAFKLRQVSERVRSDFISRLSQDKIMVCGNKSLPNKPTLAQIDELIENIRQIKSGAFQPFLEQPLVKASLLLLGGVGFSASQFTALL